MSGPGRLRQPAARLHKPGAPTHRHPSVADRPCALRRLRPAYSSPPVSSMWLQHEQRRAPGKALVRRPGATALRRGADHLTAELRVEDRLMHAVLAGQGWSHAPRLDGTDVHFGLGLQPRDRSAGTVGSRLSDGWTTIRDLTPL
ncbi:hypothetical protein RHCRD62_20624 [Rhodococcus sp. RD6.2]|nr:hypothetical protein RHCRD62_20624 [Rhodococcus sp. RD6.2]